MTTASAPRGGTASALSSAVCRLRHRNRSSQSRRVEAVSNAALTPAGGKTIGVGAMSAGYGATSFAITYEATAVFDFTAPRAKRWT